MANIQQFKLCQLCQTNQADHVWQRGKVLHLCGRCFYWLAGKYKIHTDPNHLTVIAAVAIITQYRTLKRQGSTLATFVKVTADEYRIHRSAVYQLLKGTTFRWLYLSMRGAGIPGTEWEFTQ